MLELFVPIWSQVTVLCTEQHCGFLLIQDLLKLQACRNTIINNI